MAVPQMPAMISMPLPVAGLASAGRPQGPKAGGPGSGMTEAQRAYMTQIVTGMQNGDIGTVAAALSGAVRASVSIPDAFLATVKQWMDTRQQAQGLFQQPVPVNAAALPRPGVFNQLQLQLEDAIKKKDTQAMSTVLQHAATLAARSGTTPAVSSTMHSPLAMPGVSLGLTPAGLAAGIPPPPPQQQGFVPLPRPLPRPATQQPALAPWQMPPQVTQQQRQPPPPPPPLPRPHLQTAPSGTRPPLPGPHVPPPPPQRPALQHEKVVSATFSPTFNASDAGVDPEFGTTISTKVMSTAKQQQQEHSTPLPPMMDLPPLDLENGPSEEEIVAMLRTTSNDSATFRQINLYFHPPPGTEYVRRVVESRPQVFAVVVDQVTLRDPQKREALNRLVRELVRAPLTKRLVKPDEACEPISCAARYALQASPMDVAKILTNVARNTLRRTGKVRKGTYPANMPLVIACLVDCIVTNERKKGLSKRFEEAFSPLIYQMIFQRWVLGSIPGSQFLTNLLVTWERSGYFHAKHIEECKKPLWLLVAYARSDGVPDSPDKENGTGWYKIVKRDPGFTDGAEAVCTVRMAERRTECESVVLESGISRTMAPSEVSSTDPTDVVEVRAAKAASIAGASAISSAAPTELMRPPATRAQKKPQTDASSVATTATEVVVAAPVTKEPVKETETSETQAEEPPAKRSRTDEAGEASAPKPT